MAECAAVAALQRVSGREDVCIVMDGEAYGSAALESGLKEEVVERCHARVRGGCVHNCTRSDTAVSPVPSTSLATDIRPLQCISTYQR